MTDGQTKPDPLKKTKTLLQTRGWVSLRDFCGIADVTYPTALRWCKLGMIQYVQVGGIKRVYEEEIARFLQQGTLTPDPDKWQVLNDKRSAYRRSRAANPQNRTRGGYGPHR